MSDPSSNQVLVIDIDQNRGNAFLQLLNFIKVDATLITPAQLDDFPQKSLIAYLAIFSTADESVVKHFLQLSKAHKCHVPLVLIEQSEESESLVGGVQLPYFASLPYQADYFALSQILERARVHNKRERRMHNRQCQQLIGSSHAVERINRMIDQVAETSASVLVLGESGTGKEVIARNIHAQSSRGAKPFVPINCGAIPADLLESELFGHEKGAFTGAISARQGRFELAEGGTIFLDEIGDMPLPMQVKLLRVLQEHCYEKVGSNTSIKTDVRVIAATHRRLEDMIERGRFREDLFYRLNVFPIEVTPLRERPEDVSSLIMEMVARLERDKRGTVRLSKNAVAMLQHYDWPGNVRELGNLIERLAILHPNEVVDARDLPEKYQSGEVSSVIDEGLEAHEGEDAGVGGQTAADVGQLPSSGIDMKQYLTDIEISLIEQALNETNHVVARAATMLKMRRTTLVEKMRKYSIGRLD